LLIYLNNLSRSPCLYVLTVVIRYREEAQTNMEIMPDRESV
jgi:hypothetical protein